MRNLFMTVIAFVAISCTTGVDGAPFDDGGSGGGHGGDDTASTTDGDSGQSSTHDNGASDTDSDEDGPPHADPVGPVPEHAWVNVTNNLANFKNNTECGNAAQIFASPWKDMLITGVARNGLFASTDGGASWSSLGTGGGATILHRMITVLWDPTDKDRFWESGIYGWENPYSEGAFVTTDNGNTFKAFANMGAQKQSHNDSISVDFTDAGRKTILSGGHEQGVSDGEGLFLSKDGGDNFEDIMTRLPAELGFCVATLVINADILLVGCSNSYKGQTPGIVRSTNGGDTWELVTIVDKNGLEFDAGQIGAYDRPLLASDGSIYWTAAGDRGGMLKSTDQGATFELVADNNQDDDPSDAYDNQTGAIAPIELPDGRIVSLNWGRKVVVSSDKGVTWRPMTFHDEDNGNQVTEAAALPFPWSPNGLSYSAFRRAFYASYFDCVNNPNSMPDDAYARFGWDYEVE